jgi:Ca2+-binding RTX toxin-like protein
MRKFGLIIAFVLGLMGLATAPSLAQSAADVPVCAGVSLTSPADGAVLQDDYRVKFTWSAEPKGTASREWVSIRLGGDKNGNFSIAGGTHAKADKGAYKAFARGRPGIYTWFVLFKDARGHIICMSKTRKYIIGDQEFASLSGGTEAGVTVTYSKTLKRYVVVLNGRRGGSPSPYVGPADLIVASNDYDGSGAPPAGYDGLEIHGNNKDNKIKGSSGSDLIFGYAGNDDIRGNAGDDTINGGDESCGAFCAAGDEISGGDGNDTINGGNESCGALCTAGDRISGGNGDDTINGGDESCGALCGAGDRITGDDGSDTINGGNETCTALCTAGDLATGNFPGNAEDGDKDVVNGQGGSDAVSGTGADVVTP